MIRKLTIFSIAVLILSVACKKSNSDAKPSTPTDTVDSVAILGKWKPIRDVEYHYTGSTLVDSEAAPLSSSDSYTFNSNGSIYVLETYSPGGQPAADTVLYHIIQNKYMVIDNARADTLSIYLGKDSLLLTSQFAPNIPANPTPYTAYDTLLLVR